MNLCQQRGSTTNYCREACSYGQSRSSGLPPLPDYSINVPDAGKAFEEGQEWARKRAMQKERDKLELERIALEREKIAAERKKLSASSTNGNQSTTPASQADATGPTNSLLAASMSANPESRSAFYEWMTNSIPRAGKFEGFLTVVLNENAIISPEMFTRIKSSKYAADISWYLAKNQTQAEAIQRMSAAEMAMAITNLEANFR
jgi:hypothetical protein